MSSSHTGKDTKAAFIGLVLGAIVLFGAMYTIVQLTNSHYAGEKEATEGVRS